MGIDAQMLVRTREAVTPEQVRSWAYELHEAFGDALTVYRPVQHSWMAAGRHCLAIVDRYGQDGDDITPEPGETLIEVYLAGRYYGPGYERGDLPTIIAVAQWLEAKVPGAEVWYGGDSSGVLAEPFGEDERAELWAHFVEHGHRPYLSGWGAEGPPCGFCGDKPMHCFGGRGLAEDFYRCLGCGQSVVRSRHSGEVTITDENWNAAMVVG